MCIYLNNQDVKDGTQLKPIYIKTKTCPQKTYNIAIYGLQSWPCTVQNKPYT